MNGHTGGKKCFINLNEIFIRTKLKQRSTHTHLLSSDTASYSNHQFLILREGGVGREGGKEATCKTWGNHFLFAPPPSIRGTNKISGQEHFRRFIAGAEKIHFRSHLFSPSHFPPTPSLGQFHQIKVAIALTDLHVFLAHGKGYKAHKLGIFCPPSNKVINKFYNRRSSLKHIIR